jgi:N-acetylneuraminic acid mutarotase
MRQLMVVLLAGLAVACAEESTAPDPATPESAPAVTAALSAGSWVARAPYPVDWYDATSASVTKNDRTTMYVIGGHPRCCSGPAGQISDRVRAYDASTNTWSIKAPYPVRIRSTNGAVEINGKIYVSGGFTRRWDPVAQVYRIHTVKSFYVYTPGTNTWARKRDMPMATVNGASAGYNGMLYVAASCSQSSQCPATSSKLWRYNPGTDQWSTVATRPVNYWDVAGGIINGKLYLVEPLGGMDVFDIATGAWTSGPKRPYRYCATASTSWQARLYLFGGCDDSPTDPDWRQRGMVFDPAGNSWSDVTPGPVPTGVNTATLARLFVNGKPRLSLVGGPHPANHHQFIQ